MSNTQGRSGARSRSRSGSDTATSGSFAQDLEELRRRYAEISDLAGASAVLGWDQATYMPKGGAGARGRQSATLNRIAHQKATDPELGHLLDRLAKPAEDLDADSDDACLVRVARRDFERSTKVPEAFVARSSAAFAASYNAWTRARPENDFVAMRGHLETILDLNREWAGYFAPWAHIADPHIDSADEGQTTETVRTLFADLRAFLVPLVRAISEKSLADDSCLKGRFPEAQQIALSLDIAQAFGYALDRGRLDKTHHPFCTRFAGGDIRITTRVREDDIGDCLFSVLHEAGHAMYEQGVAASLDGTPLGSGASAGVHESQSRLWENLVGRSQGFWEWAFPKLKAAFPGSFDGVSLDTFYKAINRVERSLIRTDADEVTYNLHVMMRFDLEIEMLEGRLAVKDLPEAWRERFRADFGFTPPDDRDGCLQDVHWYAGSLGGGFQGYTIGNIMSVQLFDAAVRALPGIPDEIRAGQFAPLHTWLTDNLYRHGRKHPPAVLIEKATGSPLSTKPYKAYLRKKYAPLYGLPII